MLAFQKEFDFTWEIEQLVHIADQIDSGDNTGDDNSNHQER